MVKSYIGLRKTYKTSRGFYTVNSSEINCQNKAARSCTPLKLEIQHFSVNLMLSKISLAFARLLSIGFCRPSENCFASISRKCAVFVFIVALIHTKLLYSGPWVSDDLDVHVSRSATKYEEDVLDAYKKIDTILSSGRDIKNSLEPDIQNKLGSALLQELQKLPYLESGLAERAINISIEAANSSEESTGLCISIADLAYEANNKKSSEWFSFFKKYLILSNTSHTISISPYFSIGSSGDSTGFKISYGHIQNIGGLNSFQTLELDAYSDKNHGLDKKNSAFAYAINFSFGFDAEFMQIIWHKDYRIKHRIIYKKGYGIDLVYNSESKSTDGFEISLVVGAFAEERYNFLRSTGMHFGLWIKS